MGALTVRDSLWGRLWRWPLRLLGVVRDLPHSAGADYAIGVEAAPTFSPDAALLSMAEFGWVYACIEAIATDLSGLPLVARDARGERIDSHPALALLAQPSSRVMGRLLRQQLVTDYILSGNGYALVLPVPDAGPMALSMPPQALLRLPPQRVTIAPWPDGQPGHYHYDDQAGGVDYPYERILQIRGPSHKQDARSLYGTGAIEPLKNDLIADQAASNHAASTAQQGRPNGVFTAGGDMPLTPTQISKLRAQYQKQFAGKDGALFLGAAMSYTPFGLTPRDMEYEALRKFTRETILAVLDVPPARVGLPDTNYATSFTQMKKYWESLLGRAALLDDQLTRLAQMFPGFEGSTIGHDFSAVEYLQEGRDSRLARVKEWVGLGIPLADAAAYEGFDDLPTATETPAADRTLRVISSAGLDDLLELE